MLRSPPAWSILSRATQLARQPRTSSAVVRHPAAASAAAASSQDDEGPYYYPINLAIFLAGAARTKSSTRVLNISPSLTTTVVTSGSSTSPSSSSTTVNTERQSSKMVRKFEPATGWTWVKGEEDYNDEHYHQPVKTTDQQETFFGVKGEEDGGRQQYENEVSWAALRRTSSRG